MYEPIPPENVSVLFTAFVVEHVLKNRDTKDYPRKLMRAGQLLLQSLYSSDLLIRCVGDDPAGIPSANGMVMIAATDQEAADAYIAEALPPGSDASFSAASALSQGATSNGNWKSKRNAWRDLLNRAGSTHILLNPAGPGAVRILGVIFDSGKPVRFGAPQMPAEDEVPQPQQRATGRQLAGQAIAALDAGARGRPPGLTAPADEYASDMTLNTARDSLLYRAITQLDARAAIDAGQFETGIRMWGAGAIELARHGAPERAVDECVEMLQTLMDHVRQVPEDRASLTTVWQPPAELIQTLNISWRQAEAAELIRGADQLFSS